MGIMEADKRENITDDFYQYFKLYDCHPSVIKIKKKLQIDNKFSFAPMFLADIMQNISKLQTTS